MWRRGRERAKDLEKHGSDGEMRKMKVNYCRDIRGKKATAEALTRGGHDQDGTLPSTFLGSLWETGGMGRGGGNRRRKTFITWETFTSFTHMMEVTIKASNKHVLLRAGRVIQSGATWKFSCA